MLCKKKKSFCLVWLSLIDYCVLKSCTH
jgi:hypothetical protein